MALSMFQQEENFKRTKVQFVHDIGGILANTSSDTCSIKTHNKHRPVIKKGVRLSSKYIAACR